MWTPLFIITQFSISSSVLLFPTIEAQAFYSSDFVCHCECVRVFGAHVISRWCICSFVSITFPIWNPNLITFPFHKHRLPLCVCVCSHGFFRRSLLLFWGCLAACPPRIMHAITCICVWVCQSVSRNRTIYTTYKWPNSMHWHILMTFSWNVQTTVNPLIMRFSPPHLVISHAIGQFTNHIDKPNYLKYCK